MKLLELISPDSLDGVDLLAGRLAISAGWKRPLLGVVAFLFVLSSVACNLSDPGELGANQNQNVGDSDAGHGDDQDTDHNGDHDADNDVNDDPEEDVTHTEAHQWCVAAAKTTDGTVTAYNCVGPHDISGFEASGTQTRWQPGAFQVIVE